MQKPNRLFSLKRAVVLLVLFVSCLGVSEVVAECKKWTFSRPAGVTPAEFLSTFLYNCDASYMVNGMPYLTCYWDGQAAACDAGIVAENKNGGPKFTYDSIVPIGDNPNSYECHYTVANTTPGSTDYFLVDYVPVYFQPYQSHCEIAVDGPYRKCTDKGYDKFTKNNVPYPEAQRGFEFTDKQTRKIRQVNRDNNNGKLKSDLAGYTYPKPENEECVKRNDPNNPNLCVEADTFLNTLNQSGSVASGAVHHVIPKKDRQTCDCGKNSMKNAVLISRQLNKHFLNFRRPTGEITWVNEAGKKNPYPCS